VKRLLVSIAALAVGLVLVAPLVAQTQKPVLKPVPRTADGKPDLSGVWVGGGFALLFGEAELAAIKEYDAAAGRKPLPPPEPPPYKPEAEKKRQEYLARRGIDDPMARCLLSGVPRITVRPLPFEIIQQRDRVVILYEVHHAFRFIPTDGRGHPDDIEPSYPGDSVGRWEGDTLVVDVTGFNTNTWLVGVGTFHSEKLRVTERYTATGDHLRSDDGRPGGPHQAVEAVRNAEAASRRAHP
jgi:hypothetical protein